MVSELWHVCDHIRNVVDVFISNKKSCLGKHFGLIRFFGVRNIDVMIKNLGEVWFGYHNLFASITRFPKSKNSAPRFRSVSSKVEKHDIPLNSYVSVVRGVSKEIIVKDTVDDTIHLLFGDFIVEKRNSACLVKARVFPTFLNIWMLFL